MAQTHQIYQGKSMEQDQCNAKTKVWTKPAILRNNSFNFHSAGFGICKCGMGQLRALWKRRTEKIQNEAAGIFTGITKLVSIHALYEEIGWDTLDSRRRKHKHYFIRPMCTPIKHLLIYQH